MNCPHPENPSNSFDDETNRSLCQDCRKKALSGITTEKLIEMKEMARYSQRKTLADFRNIMPRLQNMELVMSEALKDDSLQDPDIKNTRVLRHVVGFMIISIHRFEINEVLNERARKG